MKRSDRELKALGKVIELLGRLPADEARRIVAYVLGRWPNLNPEQDTKSPESDGGER